MEPLSLQLSKLFKQAHKMNFFIVSDDSNFLSEFLFFILLEVKRFWMELKLIGGGKIINLHIKSWAQKYHYS